MGFNMGRQFSWVLIWAVSFHGFSYVYAILIGFNIGRQFSCVCFNIYVVGSFYGFLLTWSQFSRVLTWVGSFHRF